MKYAERLLPAVSDHLSSRNLTNLNDRSLSQGATDVVGLERTYNRPLLVIT